MFISKQEKVGILSRISTLESMVKSLYRERRAEKEKTVKESEEDVFDEFEKIFPIRKRSTISPYGDLCEYTYPFVNDLKVGQTVEIPEMGEFTLKRIQRSVTSHLHKKFGKKSYQTRISGLTGKVEIVRLK